MYVVHVVSNEIKSEQKTLTLIKKEYLEELKYGWKYNEKYILQI